MSKLLKRALKISIAPAILLIAGKFLGILGTSLIYNLNFQISNDLGRTFSVQIFFPDAATTLFVNSISNLVMVAFIAIPLLGFIVKMYLYNTAAKNPRTIVKMTRFNILKWITSKDTSFLTIFIWCAFLWIACGITIAHTLQGNTYEWIGILAGALALIASLFTIKTFEIETDNIYPIEHKRYY
jgi:hypothetical protein